MRSLIFKKNFLKLIKVLEKGCFFAFLLTFPLGIKKTIYSFSLFRSDFFTAFLYPSEIFLIFTIFLFLIRFLFFEKNFFKIEKKDFFLIFFILVLFFKTIFSLNFFLSIYYFLRTIEGILLYFYLKFNFSFCSKKLFFGILALGGAFEGILALSQFLLQKSIGFYFLGEPKISYFIRNVAKFSTFDGRYIRSIGTFPHANLLACFLVLSLVSFFWLWFKKEEFFKKQVSQFRFKNFTFLIFWIIGIFLTFFGLLTSFSRSGFAAGFISSLALPVLFFKKKSFYYKRVKFLILILILFSIIGLVLFKDLIFVRVKISPNEPAVSYREIYFKIGKELTQKTKFLGVGLGNYLIAVQKFNLFSKYNLTLPWERQPVHNFYLLILDEIGIFGLVFFFLFLCLLLFEKKEGLEKHLFFYLILGWLLWAGFDHFFWTLYQGIIIFWLSLGIFASR
ncbi:O-antigen ligase family protein [bacterium]|nr:O-antigen ligase family protein [bacterium]